MTNVKLHDGELDIDYLRQSKWFQCDSGRLPSELDELVDHLSVAWSSLTTATTEPLLKELDEEIENYRLKGSDPDWGEMQWSLIEGSTRKFEITLQWATILAALAVAASNERVPDRSTRLTAQSALLLLNAMTPRHVEAKNQSLARKGGQARADKWKPAKDALYKLIEQKIQNSSASSSQLFPNKLAAAEYFAPLLQTEFDRLGLDNQKFGLSTTIQNWFSNDKMLSELIQPVVGHGRRRNRK